MNKLSVLALVSMLATPVLLSPHVGRAEVEAPESSTGARANAPAKVRYKKGKDIQFDELVIQGQAERPEATIVTGAVVEGGDGLVRLRENFVDRIASDYAEEVQ